MPLYEFDCADCGKSAELLVRSSAWKNSAACPHCGSKKLSKKFSVFASSGAPAASAPAAPACAANPRRACCGGGPHCH